MMSLLAYSRDNFSIFFSGAFRKRFYVRRYCKYKEMSVLFSCTQGKWTWVRQWQIFREPLRGSQDLSRASPKFISHERRKRHSFLKWRNFPLQNKWDAFKREPCDNRNFSSAYYRNFASHMTITILRGVSSHFRVTYNHRTFA